MASADQEYEIEWPVTIEKVRQWAYDENAVLLSQDEDLVLHDWEYMPALLELAADPTCPKAAYILCILDDFARHHTAHQFPKDLEAAARAVDIARKSPAPVVREWAETQHKRLRYVQGIGRVGREQALQMGHDLLNALSRACPITIRAETATTFLVELSVPNGTHKEWLLIDKAHGRFRYSRHWPQGAGQPRWFQAS